MYVCEFSIMHSYHVVWVGIGYVCVQHAMYVCIVYGVCVICVVMCAFMLTIHMYVYTVPPVCAPFLDSHKPFFWV